MARCYIDVNMGKRVLMLNAGYCDEESIISLKKLGCYVITTGNRPDFKGHALADEYVNADFSDKERILQIAKEKKVDAVCPCCSDFGVKTAAYVSEQLGFRGQDTYENACILHDKDRFKAFARENSWLNTPLAEGFDSAEKALLWADTVNDYPVIVKPVDLDSGKGIMRADNYEELCSNILNAFKMSRLKRIVIEPFITGTQHSFLTFLINQKVAAVCSVDEASVVSPYHVEIDRCPATCYEQARPQMLDQINRIAQTLHLCDGIFHVQFIWHDGKAYILECMRRVLGGLFWKVAAGHGKGFDWDYWHVKAMCGFGCDDFPEVPMEGYWAYRILFAPKDGRIKKINVSNRLNDKIYETYVFHREGDIVTNHIYDPIEIFFMKFSSRSEMDYLTMECYSEISADIE